jgi:hypothetical protein
MMTIITINPNHLPGLKQRKSLSNVGKAFTILKIHFSAGNSADANLALAGQNLYSDVVLNVPLIRPKRALITDLRAVWPDVGTVSLGTKQEEDPS